MCLKKVMLIKPLNHAGVAIVAIRSVKVNNYRIHFWYVSKDEVINTLNDANLSEKRESL